VGHNVDPLNVGEVGLVPWNGKAGKLGYVTVRRNVDDKPYHTSGRKGKSIEQIDVDALDGSLVGERAEVREGDGLGRCLIGRESRNFVAVAEEYDFQQRAAPEKIEKVISQPGRPVRSAKLRLFEVKVREVRDVEPETIGVYGDQGQIVLGAVAQ